MFLGTRTVESKLLEWGRWPVKFKHLQMIAFQQTTTAKKMRGTNENRQYKHTTIAMGINSTLLQKVRTFYVLYFGNLLKFSIFLRNLCVCSMPICLYIIYYICTLYTFKCGQVLFLFFSFSCCCCCCLILNCLVIIQICHNQMLR